MEQGYGGGHIVYGSNGAASNKYWAVHRGKVNVLYPGLNAKTTPRDTFREQIASDVLFYYGDED
ncbi:hypothetical protein SDC9_200362 [bioreactor metagenome]|uniref:Uncharacterized protein n=1 Tax=bioreactor metagenome TaxID=1076179 RepID=A0A645INM0_9ZZZZ